MRHPIVTALCCVVVAGTVAPAALSQVNCIDAAAPVPIERGWLNHCLTYDSVRQVVVMIGGGDSYPDSARETWEFDGVRWRFKGFAPFSSRYKGAMAYDAARGQSVFFGGADIVDPPAGSAYSYRQDTWGWNGTTWTQLATTGPSPRWDMSMTYDAQRQRVVLFGGSDEVELKGDTWEWNGTAWSLRATNGPAADIGTRMVYDSARHLSVLVGGSQSTGTTWEWNGTSWFGRETATNLSGRHTHGMCYDSVRNKVVLYGGLGSFVGTSYEDTWEFDGIDWTLRTDQSTPGVRRDSPMVFHAGIGRVVMFGGAYTSNYFVDGKTWLYDGAAWTLVGPAGVFGQPGERTEAAGLQINSGQLPLGLMFGGSTSAGLSNQTWTYLDAYGWNPLMTDALNTPPARRMAGICVDPAVGTTTMFGGAGTGVLLNDTWEFNTTTLTWSRRDLPGPSARFGHAMTSAGAPHVLTAPILFGGFDGQQYLNDLWRFEDPATGGFGWRRVFPADGVSPPARFGATLASNVLRSKIVLFGGANGSDLFGDTWEFDLVTQKWTSIPVSGPAPRRGHTLTYDDRRGTVVLIGGTNNTTVFDDVWSFDGFQWTPAQSHVQPRFGHVAMGRPSVFGEVLVFGGQAPGSVLRGDSLAVTFNQRPVIYQQPEPQVVQPGSVAYFTVNATQALAFGWKKDGQPVSNIDGRIIGADSNQLVIADVTGADAGFYECVITNDCGLVFSYSMPLELAVDSDGDTIFDPFDNCVTVANPDQADANGDGIGDACEPPPCTVDFNMDGIVEPGDLDDFITAFFSGPPERDTTDFNDDGIVEPGDLDDFISAFFGGC